MTKYKSAIARAVFIIVLNMLLSLLYYGQSDINNTLYDITLRNLAYFFTFFMILFSIMLNNYDDTLIGFRVTKYTSILKLKVIDKIKYFTVLFSVITILQVILFYFIDSHYNMFSLIFRNFTMYLIINVSFLVVMLGKKEHSLLHVIVVFGILIFGYRRFIQFRSLGKHVPFFSQIYEPLYSLDILSLIICILTLVLVVISIVVSLYILQKKGHLVKWLD